MRVLKFLFAAVCMLCLSMPVLADVMPYYGSSLSKDTIGFLQVPKSFHLYKSPSLDSQDLDFLTWTNSEVQLSSGKYDSVNTFAALVPSKSFAFCTVVDEQDGWYKIIYDKKHNLSGWVKPTIKEDFWNLREFYQIFGKKYGLYYLRDIPEAKKNLYSAPADDAQKVGGFNIVKYIKLTIIRGNWALISVLDLDSSIKTGFIRWRSNDGQLYLFPQLDE